jgi:hypothetical protein
MTPTLTMIQGEIPRRLQPPQAEMQVVKKDMDQIKLHPPDFIAASLHTEDHRRGVLRRRREVLHQNRHFIEEVEPLDRPQRTEKRQQQR